jgi:hypothetical protein
MNVNSDHSAHLALPGSDREALLDASVPKAARCQLVPPKVRARRTLRGNHTSKCVKSAFATVWKEYYRQAWRVWGMSGGLLTRSWGSWSVRLRG